MHAVLLKIGIVQIHSYGFMLALSFLLGIWIASARAKRDGLMPGVVTDVGFFVVLAAIAGARLYYVVLHFDEFKDNLLLIINPFQGGYVGIGGLVMIGGLIGAIIGAATYFKLKKLPFLPYADAIAPTIGLGIFLTRIGCFLNGCCYGAAGTGACAISFPLNSPAGMYQHEIHAAGLLPSQLIESAGGLVIFLVIMLIDKKKPFDGFLFYLTGILYAILRFGVDFSRVYTSSERFGGLSHNQIDCIVMVIIFGGLILQQVLAKSDSQAPKPDLPTTPPLAP